MTASASLPITETIFAGSFEDVGRIVADSREGDKAVYPAGGKTSLDYGDIPTKPGVLLETSRLAAIDDYPSEDMTITVGAGIRVAELSGLLAAKGQMLPLDIPAAELATLGGAIASAASGPRRFGYGTFRDYVLGIDFISAEGRRVHGGGRVVKNVAGYDFMKMQVGALGTLGVLIQATLKLKPLPEDRAAISFPVPSDHLEMALAWSLQSATRPVGIELLRNWPGEWSGLLHGSHSGWTLVLLFEENRQAVQWQFETAKREFTDLGLRECFENSREKYGELLAGLTAWPADASSLLVFKANLTLGGVAPFCELAAKIAPDVQILSHAGNGIVWGRLAAGGFDDIAGILMTLGHSAASFSGNLIVTHCPADWKSRLSIWGTPAADWALMARLKKQLDPTNILNPGRFRSAGW